MSVANDACRLIEKLKCEFIENYKNFHPAIQGLRGNIFSLDVSIDYWEDTPGDGVPVYYSFGRIYILIVDEKSMWIATQLSPDDDKWPCPWESVATKLWKHVDISSQWHKPVKQSFENLYEKMILQLFSQRKSNVRKPRNCENVDVEYHNSYNMKIDGQWAYKYQNSESPIQLSFIDIMQDGE